MGKTADRLRERHSSRYHGTELRLADVIELLDRHFGNRRPLVQSHAVSRLIMAIAVAKADEARCGAGHVSRKGSVESLRAMIRMPEDDLTIALKNCDFATYGRIQDAHFILMGDDMLVTDSGNEWAYAPRIELSPDGAGPLCLPIGFDGLRQAISLAIDRATTDASDSADGGLMSALDASEASRTPKAGRKEKPHQIELARACLVFWNTFGSAERREYDRMAERSYISPKSRFAEDVFALAGIEYESPDSTWVANLLSKARNP